MATRIGHAIGRGDRPGVNLAIACGSSFTFLVGISPIALLLTAPGLVISAYTDDPDIHVMAVTLVKLAPMGDPMELRIHGYELTLRLDDAAQIGITPTILRQRPGRVHYVIKKPGFQSLTIQDTVGDGKRLHVSITLERH